MRKKILMIAAVLFGSAAFAFGQSVPNLPNDPATKVGKLENEMTYYIRYGCGRHHLYGVPKTSFEHSLAHQ